jgi:hypothetical protein
MMALVAGSFSKLPVVQTDRPLCELYETPAISDLEATAKSELGSPDHVDLNLGGWLLSLLDSRALKGLNGESD